MPRRRPAQLRTRSPLQQRSAGRIRQISRVSGATSRAIAELEHSSLRPGRIAEAFDGWARFVHGPARSLHDYAPGDCPCPGCRWDDPVVRREALHDALHALPAKAARELRALLRPLDELYLARSIPTPDAAHIRDLLVITPVRTRFQPPPEDTFTVAVDLVPRG